jgi:aminopeptidase N
MKSASFVQPGLRKPSYILFNADGIGYGLFPAVLDDHIYNLKKPLQRAAAYINAYENMLAGRAIEPQTLLNFLIKGLEKESNEMNLRWIAGHLSSVYWTFLSPAERTSNNQDLERSLWEALSHQTQPNNKKILFKAYQDIYQSPDAAKRVYGIWQQQRPPADVKLNEDDYTSLAATIALKTDTLNTVLQIQLDRIANPDRKERWRFLMPALSPDSTQRDRFFMSLSDIANRRKESWVTTSLSYLNHPMRQASFVKFLPETLNMLEEIKETGDLFFPQAWLGSIFSNYQTKAAWQVVENFLDTHPAYNPKLRGKILQTTDNLYRAQKLVK